MGSGEWGAGGAGEEELLIIDQCPILLFLGCANGLPRLLYETLLRSLGTSRSVQVLNAQCPMLFKFMNVMFFGVEVAVGDRAALLYQDVPN